MARNLKLVAKPAAVPLGERQPVFVGISETARYKIAPWVTDKGDVLISVNKQWRKRTDAPDEWQHGKGFAMDPSKAPEVAAALLKLLA